MGRTSPSPELLKIAETMKSMGKYARARVETVISHSGKEFPLHSLSLGTEDPEAPVLGLVGGVHGLEAIGTDVVLSYLSSLAERLQWDESLIRDLEKVRIIAIPQLNPVGMHLERRSNGNHVDLMRNSPIDAGKSASFLIGGHRISKILPWYRGSENGEMELESKVLCEFIKREAFASRASIVIDVHSGFGVRDRIWFPFAKSDEPFPSLPELFTLKSLFDRSYPNHVYTIEPQARNYRTHGDLWDYLYLEHQKLNAGNVFLPLALEMGSWGWVKKNPRQLFSFLGLFNPLKPHRKRRILRRHLPIFDFFLKASLAHRKWSELPEDVRHHRRVEALNLWYMT